MVALLVAPACSDRAADETKRGADKAVDAGKAAADKVAETTREVATATGAAVTDGWITAKLKAKFADEVVLNGSDILGRNQRPHGDPQGIRAVGGREYRARSKSRTAPRRPAGRQSARRPVADEKGARRRAVGGGVAHRTQLGIRHEYRCISMTALGGGAGSDAVQRFDVEGSGVVPECHARARSPRVFHTASVRTPPSASSRDRVPPLELRHYVARRWPTRRARRRFRRGAYRDRRGVPGWQRRHRTGERRRGVVGESAGRPRPRRVAARNCPWRPRGGFCVFAPRAGNGATGPAAHGRVPQRPDGVPVYRGRFARARRRGAGRHPHRARTILGEVLRDPRWVDSPRYGRRLRANVDVINEWRHGDIVRMGNNPHSLSDGILHRFRFQTNAEGFRNSRVRERFDMAALRRLVHRCDDHGGGGVVARGARAAAGCIRSDATARPASARSRSGSCSRTSSPLTGRAS